jgi:hypothetical protein
VEVLVGALLNLVLLLNAPLYCCATELLHRFAIVVQRIIYNIIASAIFYLHSVAQTSSQEALFNNDEHQWQFIEA